MRVSLGVLLCLLGLAGVAEAQPSPQLGINASGVTVIINSASCASQPQMSGANLCYDTTLNELFSWNGTAYQGLVTGTNAAGGSNGSIQYNLSNALAGLSGTGLVKANGSSPPTIAVSNTDYQAALSGGAPASTTIGGTGLSNPTANAFLYGNGSSPLGVLSLTADQVA